MDISRSYASHWTLRLSFDTLIKKYPLDVTHCVRSSEVTAVIVCMHLTFSCMKDVEFEDYIIPKGAQVIFLSYSALIRILNTNISPHNTIILQCRYINFIAKMHIENLTLVVMSYEIY